MASVSSTASLLSSATTTATTSSTSSSTSTSSIDWDGLIEEAVQAKLAKADTIDLKITAQEAKITAYEEMQSLLKTVYSSANTLRAPSGSSQKSSNVFLSRAAYLTYSGSGDAADYLGATVESGSDIGSYDITIQQVAKAHKVASNSVSTYTDDLDLSGVFSITGSAGTAVEITITEDMSLQEVAEAINASKGTSGVQASVLKVSESEYRLILSTTSTGQTISLTSLSGDDVPQQLGLVDEDGAFTNVYQQAAQAIFTIDGVQMTRSTNDVSDALTGVTLHLYQATSTSITVDVGNDLSAVKDAVVDLVDAYNAYRDWSATQLSSTDSTLFGDSTVRGVSLSVANALNTIIGGNSLALLGLSYDESNYLVLDEDTIDNALLSDLEAIEALLSYQASFSSTDLMLLSRGKSTLGDFTIDIVTNADGGIASASIGGDSSLFTISGTRIIGATGSIYDGFTFVYAGSTSKSVNVSLSTGLAELLYNVTQAAANTTDGTIQTLIDGIEENVDRLQTKSDDIRSAAETYRTNLTLRYARYQAAIAQAESTQDYLTQLLETWNSSS